jgi:hypothetical protein
MTESRLVLETSDLRLWILAPSTARINRVRLEHRDQHWDFELLEDAIEFIGLHPELFDSKVYNNFFDALMNKPQPRNES